MTVKTVAESLAGDESGKGSEGINLAFAGLTNSNVLLTSAMRLPYLSSVDIVYRLYVLRYPTICRLIFNTEAGFNEVPT